MIRYLLFMNYISYALRNSRPNLYLQGKEKALPVYMGKKITEKQI